MQPWLVIVYQLFEIILLSYHQRSIISQITAWGEGTNPSAGITVMTICQLFWALRLWTNGQRNKHRTLGQPIFASSLKKVGSTCCTKLSKFILDT